MLDDAARASALDTTHPRHDAPRPRRWVMTAALALGLLVAACGDGAPLNDAGDDGDTTRTTDDAAGDSLVAVAAAASGDAATESDGAELAEAENSTPTLMLTSHQTNEVVQSSTIEIRGVADPGSRIFTGTTFAEVGPYGHWAVDVELKPGPNFRLFEVIDVNGETTKQSIILNYDPPLVASAESPKSGSHDANKTEDWKHDGSKHDENKDGAWSGGEISFSAHQKYGFCGEDPPYDVFSGKAAPGTTVSVTSPYGSGSAVAGGDGHWRVKVHFPSAPLNTPFTVTASDGSTSKEFTFVHKA